MKSPPVHERVVSLYRGGPDTKAHSSARSQRGGATRSAPRLSVSGSCLLHGLFPWSSYPGPILVSAHSVSLKRHATLRVKGHDPISQLTVRELTLAEMQPHCLRPQVISELSRSLWNPPRFTVAAVKSWPSLQRGLQGTTWYRPEEACGSGLGQRDFTGPSVDISRPEGLPASECCLCLVTPRELSALCPRRGAV